jgi:hypothetical protein
MIELNAVSIKQLNLSTHTINCLPAYFGRYFNPSLSDRLVNENLLIDNINIQMVLNLSPNEMIKNQWGVGKGTIHELQSKLKDYLIKNHIFKSDFNIFNVVHNVKKTNDFLCILDKLSQIEKMLKILLEEKSRK